MLKLMKVILFIFRQIFRIFAYILEANLKIDFSYLYLWLYKCLFSYRVDKSMQQYNSYIESKFLIIASILSNVDDYNMFF